MLRAITIIGVVVCLGFIVWAYLTMTGGKDWIMAQVTPAEPPAPAAAKEEAPKPPKKEPAKPAEAKPAEATPAGQQEAKAEEKPEAKPEETAAAAPDAGAAADGVDPAGNPGEAANAAKPGTLINPYQDDYKAVAEEGRKIYMAAGCNGCHGGTGGGGMGPPLTNPVWVYGNDGDTMFRLIALGSKGIEEQGYTRQRSELVKGPMPPFGNIVKSNDDLWKLISWIWSVNTYTKPGDKAYPLPGDSAQVEPDGSKQAAAQP